MDDEPTPTELALIAAPMIAQGYSHASALESAYKLWQEAKKFLQRINELPDEERKRLYP